MAHHRSLKLGDLRGKVAINRHISYGNSFQLVSFSIRVAYWEILRNFRVTCTSVASWTSGHVTQHCHIGKSSTPAPLKIGGSSEERADGQLCSLVRKRASYEVQRAQNHHQHHYSSPLLSSISHHFPVVPQSSVIYVFTSGSVRPMCSWNFNNSVAKEMLDFK
jgi:hypothetical protein